MKAVILDGYTLNPGDLSWADLEKLCKLKVYDRTSYDLSGLDTIIERVGDADIERESGWSCARRGVFRTDQGR